MDVTLSWEEVLCAAQVGLRRAIKVKARRHVDPYGFGDDGWTQHIEGAVAEFAVSKALDLSWTGVPLDTWRGPDVGTDVQVRYRPDPAKPDLGMRSTDDPAHRYVLVHGAVPTFRLVGWKVGGFPPLPSGDGVLFIPPEDLIPMEEFLR